MIACTIRSAASSGLRVGTCWASLVGAIIGGRTSGFAPLAGLYRSEFRARPGVSGAAARPSVTLSGMGYVATDRREALETMFPYWHRAMQEIASERGFALPSRTTFEATSGPDGAYAVGTPQEVAAKIVAAHRVIGHDRQIFQLDSGGMPHADQLRAIELLGTQVKPLVDAALAEEGSA